MSNKNRMSMLPEPKGSLKEGMADFVAFASNIKAGNVDGTVEALQRSLEHGGFDH